MKKIAFVASLAIMGFAVTAFVAPKVSTGDTFEGAVTYSVSVDNPQAASMMQGSTIKTYIKGTKTKTVSDMGIYKSTTIADRGTSDEPIVLVEMMGNKYQIKPDPTKKKEDKDPVIKYTDDTKTIAGYNCQKAEVTITGDDGQSYTTNVYYTEDIVTPPAKNGQFKGMKGFPLEFSMKQRGMNMAVSATKVDKQSVSDDTFTVPSGYKLMTREEMQADIQKNMQSGN
jgi:GLPGLI family protein